MASGLHQVIFICVRANCVFFHFHSGNDDACAPHNGMYGNHSHHMACAYGDKNNHRGDDVHHTTHSQYQGQVISLKSYCVHLFVYWATFALNHCMQMANKKSTKLSLVFLVEYTYHLFHQFRTLGKTSLGLITVYWHVILPVRGSLTVTTVYDIQGLLLNAMF